MHLTAFAKKIYHVASYKYQKVIWVENKIIGIESFIRIKIH